MPGRSFYRHAEDAHSIIRYCYCKRPETLDTAARLLQTLPAHLALL